MKNRVVWFYGVLMLSFFVLVAMKAAPAGTTSIFDNSVALRVTRTPSLINRHQPTATTTKIATLKPSATSTAVPSKTPTAQPGATSTAASGGPVIGGLAVDPVILGTCTAAIHDRYVVTGPDGKLYRTWHPPVVARDLANPSAGTCAFAHEHGDDPTTSLANNTLPAFGYVGDLAGFPEPHEAFKVFVINQGAVSTDGGIAKNSTRVIVHMGTGGAGRFDTQFHSAQFDLVAPDGHFVHLQGMADAGGVSSICANPRQSKTVVTIPGTGCAIDSLYEIWSMILNVHTAANAEKVHAIFAPAVFDVISIMNPADLPGHRVLYLTQNYFPGGPFFGCHREEYSGPVYWYNANGPTTYHTDAFGLISATGALIQQVSAHNTLGIQMSSTNQYQMLLAKNQCVPGLGAKN